MVFVRTPCNIVFLGVLALHNQWRACAPFRLPDIGNKDLLDDAAGLLLIYFDIL